MKPELIFLLVMFAAVVGVVAYTVISFNKKKLTTIVKAQAAGTVGKDDVCIKGSFKVNMGKALKAGLTGRIASGKQYVGAINKDKITLFLETEGIFTKNFNDNIVIEKTQIKAISMDRQFKNNITVTLIDIKGESTSIYMTTLKKGESIEKAKELLNTYNENKS